MARYQGKARHYREPVVTYEEDDDADAIVILDLETSGFTPDSEILQIAARTLGREPFSAYINPAREIPDRVTDKNGFGTYNGKLTHYGELVPTIPMSAALKSLHNWLRSLGQNCYIAVHNLPFAGPRLLQVITKHSSRKKYGQVVDGFIDTLRVIRNTTGWKGRCNLAELANHFNVSGSGARNAVYKCEVLQKILSKLNITQETLLKYSKGFSDRVDHWDNLERIRKRLATLTPLRNAVGLSVLKKLARAGIDMEMLESYDEDFDDVVGFLRDEIQRGSLQRMSESSIQKIAEAVADGSPYDWSY